MSLSRPILDTFLPSNELIGLGVKVPKYYEKVCKMIIRCMLSGILLAFIAVIAAAGFGYGFLGLFLAYALGGCLGFGIGLVESVVTRPATQAESCVLSS